MSAWASECDTRYRFARHISLVSSFLLTLDLLVFVVTSLGSTLKFELRSQHGHTRSPVEVKFTWVPQAGQKGKRKEEDGARDMMVDCWLPTVFRIEGN